MSPTSYFCTVLISTSTPAGRSSFMSAIDRLLGWLKDIDQPLVGANLEAPRATSCRRGASGGTQYLFFIVGSGMGPATWAPVRLAVSTISPVDVSNTR